MAMSQPTDYSQAPKTPLPIGNRAGLPTVDYRIGTHASIMRTMIARLSEWSQTVDDDGASAYAALEKFTSRDLDDAGIALLDAWASLGDSLSFYQERIANECFLGTAQERASVEYLARMIGFTPRPGLSASVFLSFEVDESSPEVVIPKGTPAKSTPLPGSELKPETFETSGDFIARPQWNLIRPRQRRPYDFNDESSPVELTFEGGGLGIKQNDWIVIEPKGGNGELTQHKVVSVREITDDNRNQFTIARFLVGKILNPKGDALFNEAVKRVRKFAEKLDPQQPGDDGEGSQIDVLFRREAVEEAILKPYISERADSNEPSLLRDDQLVEEYLVKQLIDVNFKSRLSSYKTNSTGTSQGHSSPEHHLHQYPQRLLAAVSNS